MVYTWKLYKTVRSLNLMFVWFDDLYLILGSFPACFNFLIKSLFLSGLSIRILDNVS